MDASIQADHVLDLAEKGCGQLLTNEIMSAMHDLAPGQSLLVTANDPAAPLDIRVWCRMTGNTLVRTFSDSAGHQFLLRKGL